MVVEPGQDLDVGAVGEAVVGEVGLPGLVRLLGGEADVGGLRLLLRFRNDETSAAHGPVDRRSGDGELVVVFEVPGDRVGSGVQPGRAQSAAQLEDQLHRRRRGCIRPATWPSRTRGERCLTLSAVPGNERIDPRSGHAVGACHLRR